MLSREQVEQKTRTAGACHFLTNSPRLLRIHLHIMETWCFLVSACHVVFLFHIPTHHCSNDCWDLEAAPLSFVVCLREGGREGSENLLPTPLFCLHHNNTSHLTWEHTGLPGGDCHCHLILDQCTDSYANKTQKTG